MGSRHVVVVGGGVIGCAIAYRLARAGLAVTLIERDAIGAHASGQNAGNLNPLYGTAPDLLPFALASYRLHGDLRAGLVKLGYSGGATRPVQRIFLGCDQVDRAHLRQTAALFNATDGFSATWLEDNELNRIQPRLNRELVFGIVTTGGLAIDSYDFTCALAQAATGLGATIRKATVLSITKVGARVITVQTDNGAVPCDELIFATGPWVADVESWLGINIPVQPVKGELLLLEMLDEMPPYDLTWRDSCFYRRRENEIWLGGTMDACGFDTIPTSTAREFLLQGGAQIFPSIRQAKVLRHVAALRPVAQSNAPVACGASGWENVYIANGGGAKGVLLSAGIAAKICDLLIYGRSNFPPEHLPA